MKIRLNRSEQKIFAEPEAFAILVNTDKSIFAFT